MTPKSWVVSFEAKSGPALLGGARSVRSIRFGSSGLASRFLAVLVSAHERAGIPALGGVTPSDGLPQIIIHCGDEPQAVGEPCSGCGRVLTEKDAAAAKDAHPEYDECTT